MSDSTALHRFARALARRRGYAEHADDFAQWLALASLTRPVRWLEWEFVDFLRELGGDFRREQNRVSFVPLDSVPDPGCAATEPVFTDDVSLVMSRAGLTAAESEAVRRHFWYGESFVEIGVSRGVTGAAIQMTLKRALRRLRKIT